MVNKVVKYTDTIRELVLIYISIIAVSSILFGIFEHKTIFESIWWSMVTAMTIGYGDLYPVTIGGKVVAMALMHVVPLFVIPIVTARIASKLIVNSDAFTHAEQQEIKKTLREINKKLK